VSTAAPVPLLINKLQKIPENLYVSLYACMRRPLAESTAPMPL